MYMLMVLNMKDHGKMIYNMDMVLKLGMMVVNMREIMLMVKSKEMVFIHGLMVQGIIIKINYYIFLILLINNIYLKINK